MSFSGISQNYETFRDLGRKSEDNSPDIRYPRSLYTFRITVDRLIPAFSLPKPVFHTPKFKYHNHLSGQHNMRVHLNHNQQEASAYHSPQHEEIVKFVHDSELLVAFKLRDKVTVVYIPSQPQITICGFILFPYQ